MWLSMKRATNKMYWAVSFAPRLLRLKAAFLFRRCTTQVLWVLTSSAPIGLYLSQIKVKVRRKSQRAPVQPSSLTLPPATWATLSLRPSPRRCKQAATARKTVICTGLFRLRKPVWWMGLRSRATPRSHSRPNPSQLLSLEYTKTITPSAIKIPSRLGHSHALTNSANASYESST